MKKLKVLMLGPARNVKGGMTAVVDNYFNYGLDKEVDLKYIETVNDKNKILKLIKIIKGYIEYKKYIKNYDVVHIHMASRRSTFRKGKYIRIAKKNGKKVIVHIHGAEFKTFYEKECSESKKKYVREILKLSDVIVVLSEEWKKYFKHLVDENKIKVIYNAIVIPEDFKKDLDTQKILFLGRFGKRKGIYDLIDVMERIVKKYPELTLYAGGDGEIEKVKTLVTKKNLDCNIKILGWIKGEEKEKLLKEVSFYILPSYNEGMPMSLIEAMAYKNVVISTNVGGIPEVITNNENGIIIEPGDKEELYKKLSYLLDKTNEDIRTKLSKNARQTTEEKFNIKNNIKKLIEVY